ncbi:MAG TPA: hypothetical protein VNI01_06585, partial [Elusimicrobiota bacterium]|nr:hypothetical protein [Elusimicrobiota bacterium]
MVALRAALALLAAGAIAGPVSRPEVRVGARGGPGPVILAPLDRPEVGSLPALELASPASSNLADAVSVPLGAVSLPEALAPALAAQERASATAVPAADPAQAAMPSAVRQGIVSPSDARESGERAPAASARGTLEYIGGKAGGAAPSAARIERVFDARAERAQDLAPVPASDVVLARARERGVPLSRLGAAIQGAADYSQARAALDGLGLLQERELPLTGPEETTAFSYLLHALWKRAAPHTPAQFEASEGWSVPTWTVRKDGVTYYVHAVAHRGAHAVDLMAAGLGRVRDLIARLRAEGSALYSEQ